MPELVKKLNVKLGESWVTVKGSKYNKDELFGQFWYLLTEDEIKNRFSKVLDGENVLKVLKNELPECLARQYFFINLKLRTLEVYEGERTDAILNVVKRIGVAKPFETKEEFIDIEPEKKLNNIKWYANIEGNEITIPEGDVFRFKPRYEIRQVVNKLVTEHKK
jgi:hypothetical protein